MFNLFFGCSDHPSRPPRCNESQHPCDLTRNPSKAPPNALVPCLSFSFCLRCRHEAGAAHGRVRQPKGGGGPREPPVPQVREAVRVPQAPARRSATLQTQRQRKSTIFHRVSVFLQGREGKGREGSDDRLCPRLLVRRCRRLCVGVGVLGKGEARAAVVPKDC